MRALYAASKWALSPVSQFGPECWYYSYILKVFHQLFASATRNYNFWRCFSHHWQKNCFEIKAFDLTNKITVLKVWHCQNKRHGQQEGLRDTSFDKKGHCSFTIMVRNEMKLIFFIIQWWKIFKLKQNVGLLLFIVSTGLAFFKRRIKKLLRTWQNIWQGS